MSNEIEDRDGRCSDLVAGVRSAESDFRAIRGPRSRLSGEAFFCREHSPGRTALSRDHKHLIRTSDTYNRGEDFVSHFGGSLNRGIRGSARGMYAPRLLITIELRPRLP